MSVLNLFHALSMSTSRLTAITMRINELKEKMNEIGVSDIHQTMIIKSLSNDSNPTVETEEKMRQVEEAKKEVESLRNQLKKDKDAISEEALSNLNAAIGKVLDNNNSWKLSLKSGSEMLSDLDIVVNRLNVVEESCTRGNYANNADLINCISGSAMCKAVHFVGSPIFGERGALNFLDFSKSYKEFGEITIYPAPSFSDKTERFSSAEEFSVYEKLRKTGGSATSVSASVAGF